MASRFPSSDSQCQDSLAGVETRPERSRLGAADPCRSRCARTLIHTGCRPASSSDFGACPALVERCVIAATSARRVLRPPRHAGLAARDASQQRSLLDPDLHGVAPGGRQELGRTSAEGSDEAVVVRAVRGPPSVRRSGSSATCATSIDGSERRCSLGQFGRRRVDRGKLQLDRVAVRRDEAVDQEERGLPYRAARGEGAVGQAIRRDRLRRVPSELEPRCAARTSRRSIAPFPRRGGASVSAHAPSARSLAVQHRLLQQNRSHPRSRGDCPLIRPVEQLLGTESARASTGNGQHRHPVGPDSEHRVGGSLSAA